jgi:dipeptidyl aminopeptidase/acylaminoacyl peptidase
VGEVTVRHVAIVGLLFFGAAADAQGTASRPSFQSKDLFSLQTASDPQVRPDGRMIAYVRSSGDLMNDRMNRSIWLVNPATGEEQPIAAGPGQHANPRWAPDGKRLAYVSTLEGEKPQLMIRWMDGGTTARVAVLPETPRHISWSPDGKQLAFVMFAPGKEPKLGTLPEKPEGAKWAEPLRFTDKLVFRTDAQGLVRPGSSNIYIVPASGGAPRQLTQGELSDNGPLNFTPDGKFLIYSANRKADWMLDPVESEIWRVPVEGGVPVAITDRDGPDEDPAISPDGRKIAYIGFDDRKASNQDTRLYVMDVDGRNPRVLTQGLDRSVTEPSWSADGRSILVHYIDRGMGKVARVSLDGRVTDLVDKVGGGSLDRPYSGGEYSTASGVIAFTTADANRPADIGVYRQGRWTRLTDLNASLMSARQLGEIRELEVTSTRDGQKIHSWLVLPPDYQPGQKRPLILEIHGGPGASYGPTFATDMQLYAAAGYVVLYPNARNSESYGEAFAQWTRADEPFADYQDFMSAVDAAIAAGVADPDNLFVTGGSYGGYAAAAIIGKTDRFRAAALQKPVINWVSKILTTDIAAFQHEYTYGKQPWEDPEVLWKNSPLSLVGKVKTPTLIVVGEKDYRTPVSEAEQYYTALQLRQVPTSLAIVPGASHGGLTARPSQSAAKASAIIAWFDRYKKTAVTAAK